MGSHHHHSSHHSGSHDHSSHTDSHDTSGQAGDQSCQTDGADHSFRVHLQSLKDFATDLETQLDAIGKPSDGLAALAGHPMRLGAFAEADSLRDHHLAAVHQMHDLLGNVKEALGFAGDVTTTVATGYEHADEDIASSIVQGII